MQAEIVDDVERLWNTVHELLERAANETDGRETVRVTLNLPKAWIVLAAWMQTKEEQHRAGRYTDKGFPFPEEAPDFINAEVRRRARTFLEQRLDWELLRDLQDLGGRAHPLWRTRAQGYRREADAHDPAARQARALVDRPEDFAAVAERYNRAVWCGDEAQVLYWRAVFAEIVLIFDEEFRRCANALEVDMLERSVRYSGGQYDPCAEELAALEAAGQQSRGNGCGRITADEWDFAEDIPF